MNASGPTMELRWKFYKTKKEANESEDGEDVVGWGRHFVCRPVTETRACQWELGRVGDAVEFFFI